MTREEDWRRRVHDVVRAIPAGRVATYGLVALVAGRPRAARAVGNLMLVCDDPTVPCHRVVHADGMLGFAGQRARLRRERVDFVGVRVDVRRFLWAPRLPALRTPDERAPRPRERVVVSGSSRRRMRNVSPAR